MARTSHSLPHYAADERPQDAYEFDADTVQPALPRGDPPADSTDEGPGATALQTGMNMLNELEGAGLLGACNLPFMIAKIKMRAFHLL